MGAVPGSLVTQSLPQDEYFDYSPAEKPPQGRWKIYGLGLTDTWAGVSVWFLWFLLG